MIPHLHNTKSFDFASQSSLFCLKIYQMKKKKKSTKWPVRNLMWGLSNLQYCHANPCNNYKFCQFLIPDISFAKIFSTKIQKQQQYQIADRTLLWNLGLFNHHSIDLWCLKNCIFKNLFKKSFFFSHFDFSLPTTVYLEAKMLSIEPLLYITDILLYPMRTS